MTRQQIIDAAKTQQTLTGKTDAAVAIVVPGKWPEGGRKRLLGRRGPLGQCMSECEDSVICLFEASALLAYFADTESDVD